MNDNLTRWLVEQIEIRGWSQRELSRRAGISATTVSDVLAHKRKPTWDFCAEVAKALEVPEDEVFVLAGLKRAPLESVTEETEAVGILRGLSDSARRTVMQMLRGVARAEDLPTGNELQVRFVGEEPDPAYDPETLQMLQEIAEGLTKLSPQKREELTRKYLTLLEVEETLEEVTQQQEEVVHEE